MSPKNPAKKQKKPEKLPLSGVIGAALMLKQRGQRRTRTQAVADGLLSIIARNPRVKDPVAEVHKLLSRSERRALGERGYRYGTGAFAKSIRSKR